MSRRVLLRRACLFAFWFVTVASVAGGCGGGTNTGPDGSTGNRPPVANSFDLSVRAETPRAIVLQGTDPDGDRLTYRIVNQPFNGTLSRRPATTSRRSRPTSW